MCFSGIGRVLERFVRDQTDVAWAKSADLLQKKFKRNEVKVQAGKPAATQFINMVESEQANSYSRAAMKKYELEQARMNAR